MEQKLTTKNLTFLIICNTIGSGVFLFSHIAFSHVRSTTVTLICWIISGIISMGIGLCYAELGSKYPKDGGDAVYLTESFGKYAGYIFSIISVLIILPGGSSIMCKSMGEHLKILNIEENVAIACIILIFGFINIIRIEYKTQYFLTGAKLFVIVIFVFFAGLSLFLKTTSESTFNSPNNEFTGDNKIFRIFSVIFNTLWPYDGYNTGNFIASKIFNPSKTLPRATIISLVFIILIYLLINVSFMRVLPFEVMADTNSSIMIEYFNYLDFKVPLKNTLPYLIMIIPAAGTLNGSIFVSISIINSFVPPQAQKRALKLGMIILYSFLIYIYTFINKLENILGKISFCTFLFYGLSAVSLIILKKRERKNGYEVNRIIPYFVIIFSFSVVCFTVIKIFKGN
ncbi:amino acid permease [Hamiltosporidium magnivora]|uniref:Amino acid permease n=2 Tax=Hamiltosporidium TaxID=1176354 RepID=A0A4Q9LIA3_9MICR|nr:amino acid permease [Hamiltosporidium magnivora]